MQLKVPALSVVVLIGPSGSGKSTFARRHFRPTEILSSDAFRGWVSDDENDQSATGPAFESLHFIAGQRLRLGRLVVVDATNTQPEARKSLLDLARQHHVLAVAIVLDVDEATCRERNQTRPDRTFGAHVIRNQIAQLRRSRRHLEREGFRYVHTLRAQQIEDCTVERTPLWNDRRFDGGPFDLIGDIHGCHDELIELLQTLGYEPDAGGFRHPAGRRAVFLGDLVDRGPASIATLRLVRTMVGHNQALCVPGNHDVRFQRLLRGKNVRLTHGLEQSAAELEAVSTEEKHAIETFLDGLVSHYVLDHGRLVVAHAGLKEEFQGRSSGAVREFALYGETTGETDEFGLPVRYDWASEYRGRAMVVYGHTPVPEPEWLQNTLNIDTGCVFGGRLTALRYPERELVSVAARAVYCEPVRPLETPSTPKRSHQQVADDLLDYSDVSGKRFLETRFGARTTIREENSIAALEVLSRFAIDPKWLIYLPPTMAPTRTSALPHLLEHPQEAFADFADAGVTELLCEEKHMGSRAVLIVLRDTAVAMQRFGVERPSLGVCYSRTGRRFFDQVEVEAKLLAAVSRALSSAGVFDELLTDWVAIDAELMPWSLKAQELLRRQYAPTGASGESLLEAAAGLLRSATDRGQGLQSDLADVETRLGSLKRYRDVYRRYCWPVEGLSSIRLAPFHFLASEGAVHHEKSHEWHLGLADRLATTAPDLVQSTRRRRVDVNRPESVAEAIAWWTELTAAGGEGIVIKPLSFLPPRLRVGSQPAMKCRGSEYLRIIYGPEYSLPKNLERLRQRAVGRKRALAVREFSLGLEGLCRFVDREPLRRVHECAFGVLALESEPIDPRL